MCSAAVCTSVQDDILGSPRAQSFPRSSLARASACGNVLSTFAGRGSFDDGAEGKTSTMTVL